MSKRPGIYTDHQKSYARIRKRWCVVRSGMCDSDGVVAGERLWPISSGALFVGFEEFEQPLVRIEVIPTTPKGPKRYFDLRLRLANGWAVDVQSRKLSDRIMVVNGEVDDALSATGDATEIAERINLEIRTMML